MDHVINSIKTDLNVYLDILRAEYGGYKKITDCPSYGDCKAIVAAIHVLERQYYGEKRTLPVKELIRL
jgi:hypothetical protein